MPCLISAIMNVSPAMVAVPPVMAAVLRADNVRALEPVIRATTVLAGMPAVAHENGMPTATPDIDETLVTEALPDAIVKVGLTVALKQCPPDISSCLNE